MPNDFAFQFIDKHLVLSNFLCYNVSLKFSEMDAFHFLHFYKENTIERSQSSQDAIITNSKKSLKKSPTTRSMLSQEDVKPSLNHVSPEIMVMQDVISNDVKENDTRGIIQLNLQSSIFYLYMYISYMLRIDFKCLATNSISVPGKSFLRLPPLPCMEC